MRAAGVAAFAIGAAAIGGLVYLGSREAEASGTLPRARRAGTKPETHASYCQYLALRSACESWAADGAGGAAGQAACDQLATLIDSMVSAGVDEDLLFSPDYSPLLHPNLLSDCAPAMPAINPLPPGFQFTLPPLPPSQIAIPGGTEIQGVGWCPPGYSYSLQSGLCEYDGYSTSGDSAHCCGSCMRGEDCEGCG
jgi:hypothetical protein